MQKINSETYATIEQYRRSIYLNNIIYFVLEMVEPCVNPIVSYLGT